MGNNCCPLTKVRALGYLSVVIQSGDKSVDSVIKSHFHGYWEGGRNWMY